MWTKDDTVICIGELWDQGTVALFVCLFVCLTVLGALLINFKIISQQYRITKTSPKLLVISGITPLSFDRLKFTSH